MTKAEEDRLTRAFGEMQTSAFRDLKGFEIVEWRAREMAPDQDEEERPVWRIPVVPFVQFDGLELLGAPRSVAIATAQSDDEFSLWLPWHDGVRRMGGPDAFTYAVPVDDSPFLSQPESIFRDIRLPHFPPGVIEEVAITARPETGLVERVVLMISGRAVSLQAGEIHMGVDGSITVTSMDESILVQIDGQHPDLLLASHV